MSAYIAVGAGKPAKSEAGFINALTPSATTARREDGCKG